MTSSVELRHLVKLVVYVSSSVTAQKPAIIYHRHDTFLDTPVCQIHMRNTFSGGDEKKIMRNCRQSFVITCLLCVCVISLQSDMILGSWWSSVVVGGKSDTASPNTSSGLLNRHAQQHYDHLSGTG